MSMRGWAQRSFAVLVVVLASAVGASSRAAPALAATVYTVSGTADPSPTPTCSGTVCPSLRAAVAAANADAGSTVQLGDATYTLTQGSLQPVVAMTITGNGPSATTIRQTASDRVIFASALGTAVNISGLTITGGNVIGAAGGAGGNGGSVYGGGILNYGLMTLTNVLITGNTATGGAGGGGSSGGGGGAAFGSAIASGDQLFAAGHQDSLTLVDTTVAGNIADGGAGGSASSGAAGSGGRAVGAVFADGKTTLMLRHSVVSHNQLLGGAGGTAGVSSTSAGQGGLVEAAVFSAGDSIFPSSLTIDDSTIADNTAAGGMGGAVLDTISAGAAGGAGLGGGVSMSVFTKFAMTGSTVAGNSVTGGRGGFSNLYAGGPGGSAQGGGIDLEIGESPIVNSTITGNSADGGPGGVGGLGFPDGSQGTGAGGGVWLTFMETFASVTLTNNSATGLAPGSNGGNLDGDTSVSGTPVTLADTIVAGGSASGSGGNCDLPHPPTDNGHNLEDTTPSQCGFSGANGDMIGASPGLMSLASNGGPTQTRALGPGSQALGTGGACTDPTQLGSPPLTVDQRGFARPAGACDIGAFQFQPPGGTSAPQISGTATFGEPLACSQGNWSGDQLAFGFQWLLDSVPIAGATGATYDVAGADIGHQLACRVTASNLKGTASQTSAPVSVAFPPVSLTVSKSGDGSGTVTSSPAGISCGATCSHAYDHGTIVTLNAQAGKGSAFMGWSGACTGKPACTLSMGAALSVKATFLKDCLVPRLRGKSLKKAKRAIKAHDCTVGKVKRATSRTITRGHVISQKPKPGRNLKHGANVNLVVSKGRT